MTRTDFRDRLCFLFARVLFPCVLALARVKRIFVRDGTAPGKRKVVVLSDHRLGDTIYQIPLFEALRRAFPPESNHLAVVVRSSAVELVQTMPWFDEVLAGDALERHPILWILQGHFWKATSRRFDVLIDPVRLRVVGHDWLNVLWRPSLSVAYDSEMNRRVFPFVGLWQRLHSDGRWTRLTAAEKGRAISDVFQWFVDAAAGPGTKVDLSVSWTVSPLNASIRTKPADVVLAPGSNATCRRWPISCFRTLVETLLRKQPALRFTVVGGKNETALGNDLSEAFPGSVENLCGKTSIVDLAAVLSPAAGCRVVVSNDSGTAHLAAVQGTKTVVILGGGEFGSLFPAPQRPNVRSLFSKRDCFGCEWRCRYADLDSTVAPCVEDVRVEDVVAAVEEWL